MERRGMVPVCMYGLEIEYNSFSKPADAKKHPEITPETKNAVSDDIRALRQKRHEAIKSSWNDLTDSDKLWARIRKQNLAMQSL